MGSQLLMCSGGRGSCVSIMRATCTAALPHLARWGRLAHLAEGEDHLARFGLICRPVFYLAV
jgi:hypothetical protein